MTMKIRMSGKIFTQAFLLLWLLLCLFPMYWLLSFSLKDTDEIFRGNLIGLPQQWLFSNYTNAWGSGGKISMFMMNSVIVTAVTLLITSFLGFMSAYGLLRMRWKGQKVVFTYILMGMMIPIRSAISLDRDHDALMKTHHADYPLCCVQYPHHCADPQRVYLKHTL